MYLRSEMGDSSRHISKAAVRTKYTSMLPFALRAVGDFTCDRKYFTERWDLEECLLLYTISGSGTIRYQQKEWTLKPGQLFAMDCRKYQYYATKEECWHFLWIHFYGRCAFDYVDMLNAEGESPLYPGNRISLPDYYEELAAYTAHFDLQSELEVSLTLQKLLTELIQVKKTEEFSGKYGSYRTEMEESIAYLQNHYSDDLTIEQLAEACHLSKYYYIKVFKAHTGQTPYDYLVNIRLQQAQKMLMESKETVGAIALKCGFADDKNFIACFKKRAGMTPLQFRKHIRT